MNNDGYDPESAHAQIMSFKSENKFSDDKPCCANCAHGERSGSDNGLVECTKAGHHFFARPFAVCERFERVGREDRKTLDELLSIARAIGQLDVLLNRLVLVKNNFGAISGKFSERIGSAIFELDKVYKEAFKFLSDHKDDVK